MTDDLVGRLCHVTISIPGGPSSPGEVRLVYRGMTHLLVAYAEAPLPLGSEAWVLASRGANAVDVRPA